MELERNEYGMDLHARLQAIHLFLIDSAHAVRVVPYPSGTSVTLAVWIRYLKYVQKSIP